MIGVLGINHKTANIEIREAFYIAEDEIIPLSEQIQQQTDITETVILSTCNRTEIYFYRDRSGKQNSIEKLVQLLKEFKNFNGDVEEAFYLYTYMDAVKHLFEVTSGIDSLVVGENQIVNQVKEFYMKSTQAALTGAMLMRLFQKSFETSKRVRTDTNIQQGATSVSYVAVDWCYKKLKNLSDKNILLIGTGETGKIALSHLADKGAKNFFLTNRTAKTAEKCATLYQGKAIPFENFKEQLPQCDIVIAATNAKEHLITKSDVQSYINGRQSLFVDLSVPRNIDDSINELTNAEVVAVDGLSSSVEKTNQMRMDSIESSLKIIEELSEEYMVWFEQRRLRPLISAITKSMNEIHQTEMANSRKFHSDEEMKIMEVYGARLTQKYTRNLIKKLKHIADKQMDERSIETIMELFKLDD